MGSMGGLGTGSRWPGYWVQVARGPGSQCPRVRSRVPSAPESDPGSLVPDVRSRVPVPDVQISVRFSGPGGQGTGFNDQNRVTRGTPD